MVMVRVWRAHSFLFTFVHIYICLPFLAETPASSAVVVVATPRMHSHNFLYVSGRRSLAPTSHIMMRNSEAKGPGSLWFLTVLLVALPKQ